MLDFGDMKVCWNCHRSVDVAASTCTHCAAALPVAPAPSPGQAGPLPVRARAKFVLNAAPAGPSLQKLEPKPGEEGAEQRSLKQALIENRRAATALILSLFALAMSWWISAPAAVLGTANCWSISEARRKNLFDRLVSVSPHEFEFGGRKITIEGAWIGQIGEVRFTSPFSDERVYVPTGRRRLYFKTRYVGWPDRPEYWHGSPPRLCGVVEPTARVRRFVLHYIDVASADPVTREIFVKDSARPDLGTVRLVLN